MGCRFSKLAGAPKAPPMDSPKDLPPFPPEVRILSNKEDVAICGILKGPIAAIQQAHANHLIAALRARLALAVTTIEQLAEQQAMPDDFWIAVVEACREPS